MTTELGVISCTIVSAVAKYMPCVNSTCWRKLSTQAASTPQQHHQRASLRHATYAYYCDYQSAANLNSGSCFTVSLPFSGESGWCAVCQTVQLDSCPAKRHLLWTTCSALQLSTAVLDKLHLCCSAKCRQQPSCEALAVNLQCKLPMKLSCTVPPQPS